MYCSDQRAFPDVNIRIRKLYFSVPRCRIRKIIAEMAHPKTYPNVFSHASVMEQCRPGIAAFRISSRNANKAQKGTGHRKAVARS